MSRRMRFAGWLGPAAILVSGCGGPASGSASPSPLPAPRAARATPAAGRAASQPPANVAGAAAVALARDTLLRFGAGGELLGAKGWFLTRRPDVLILEDPGRELSLAVSARPEADPALAISAAWKLLRPAFARPVRQRVDLPARQGWDAVTQISYEVPDRERGTAIALARRKNKVWYVTLIEGRNAALERRSGSLQTCIESLRAPGVEEESFAGKPARPLDQTRLRQFETFAEWARQKLGVPGVAVALIQGGKVIYEKGLGVRALGRRAPVTPRTLFLIGSITKSMTSLLMAALVDRGKLTWDTPVAPLLPGFALGDPEATRKLTLRHTVCACTGLPRQDMEFLFQYRGVTPEKRLEEMRSMKPTTGFGEAFQYSNPMVSAGGYIAAHLLYPTKTLGDAFDTAMAGLVFRPAGMSSTTFDFRRALRGDHAAPHGMTRELGWKAVPISNEEWLPAVRPAGGAWSNLRDMSRYLLLHLNGGTTPEGIRVVSEENLTRRYQPQVRMSKHMSYGLGLVVERTYGVETIWHSGGTAGFSTEIFFLPRHGFGAVILTNGGGSFLSGALRRKLFELLFDGRDEARANLEGRWKRLQDAMAREAGKVRVNPDRRWLEGVSGNYQNPSLGPLSVRLQGEEAILDVGEWQSRVGQKREFDGTTKLVLLDPPWIDLELLPGERNGRRTLQLETNQQKYLFVETQAR